MEKTPWVLVRVPLPVPLTTMLTAGSPLRLSAVITTPYNCTTESLNVSNCALAKEGSNPRNKHSRKKGFLIDNILCKLTVSFS
jgi:hypothetical protein